MDRLRAPPLLLFAVTSFAMHLAALGLLRRSGAPHAPTFEGSFAALSGDTLEVDPAPPASPDLVEDGQQATARPAPSTVLDGNPAAFGRGRSAATSGVGAARPMLFGAVGTRYATDLATTLTLTFPQAASADPIWYQVPIGPAGTADLVIALDEDGHISETSVIGRPTVALRRGIERTLSLLMLRSFTAHAAVTHLRVTARVSPNDVHDGLHGDVFALSRGSFSGDVGSAFFALPPREPAAGRRVDVELRLVP